MLSFAELKFILSILCVTLRFICEPLREKKGNLLVIPTEGEVHEQTENEQPGLTDDHLFRRCPGLTGEP
jgi:hypothetical protein